MTYRVVHHAYCGMAIPLAEGLSWSEAHARVYRRIAWFKDNIDGPVTWIGPGRWEMGEPETCAMVPDACGLLCIEKEARR